MTTATKNPIKPSVMDGLAEREQKLNEARVEADALAREHGTKLRAAQALVDERRRAVHRDPSLVDHRSEPTSKDNEVAIIDGELRKLGDLEDLGRKVEHARQLERSAKQSWDDFVVAHYTELIEAKRPEPLRTEGPPNFDGGVRETAPLETDPAAEHNQVILDLVQEGRLGGGPGVIYFGRSPARQPATEQEPDEGDWRKAGT